MDKVYEIVAEVLGIEQQELQSNLDSNEIWNSLAKVEIIFEIEEQYGFTFEEKELAQLSTPRVLYETVCKKNQA